MYHYVLLLTLGVFIYLKGVFIYGFIIERKY